MIYRIKIVQDGKFVRYANKNELRSLRVNSQGIVEMLEIQVKCIANYGRNDSATLGRSSSEDMWQDVTDTYKVEWGCVHEGKELYESDIVTAPYYLFQDEGKYNYHGLIYYDKESYCMGLSYVCVAKDRRGISNGIGNMLSEYRGLILLGNANLNPELLEVQND